MNRALKSILNLMGIILLTSCSNILSGFENSRISAGSEVVTEPSKAPSFDFQLGNILSGVWAPAQPPSFNERCAGVETDDAGNIYCIGQTASELFDTNSSNLDDILAFKISPNGNLVWATQIGETSGVPGGDSTQADACFGIAYYDGGLYCVGRSRGSLGHAGSGGNECVVVRFDAQDGSLSWVRQFTSVSCNGVGVDATGVYVGGGTSANLGEMAGGSSDVLVIKLDHSGNDVWMKQLGSVTPVPGSTAAQEFCRDLSVDGSGNSYCGGTTKGSLGETFGGGVDVFMAKFDVDGHLVWLSQAGAVSIPATGSAGSDLCWSVALNENGAFCGGRTTGNLGDTNSGAGLTDTLVAHFNKDTGALEWVHQIGATSSIPTGSLTAGSGVCDELATDDDGAVYCGGRTGSDLFEGQGGNQDAMVYKLDANGNFVWGLQLGSTSAQGDPSEFDSIFGMTVSHGQVYAGGDTNGSLFENTAGGRDLVLFTVDAETGILGN